MNNFKKFVTVLLGVLMACVFATSAFAADFSNADTAAKAKAEIKAFARAPRMLPLPPRPPMMLLLR